ncbi:hypothetical protein BACT_1400 [Bifidobacterium actinocoloniiforme DSM 22766]|uniref:Uncharacterized protein n=1 Tax=Bifidobacterium actinocoloniiforme DSM 22766 TaxID=1437605 RepID=A0A086Z2E6_9BIFI|nr:hypothetical protein [Bifidobacterium actinocoloniiforme]KFI40696.1 hypothetical protein BACT_1400 [Bifidobacterium actinocoloniiforme DSM 22766]
MKEVQEDLKAGRESNMQWNKVTCLPAKSDVYGSPSSARSTNTPGNNTEDIEENYN